ncbi:hypothetical protein BH09BAC2_BH09BAC2_02500 [soil metagenome]
MQTLPAGTFFAITAKVDNGEPVNNNRVWFKDANENYFWSGGVKLQVDIPVVATPVAPVNIISPAAGHTPYKPDDNCFDFIKKHEGLKLTAYKDSAGIWTIGYGCVLTDQKIPVKQGDSISPQVAEVWLKKEVNEKSVGVSKIIDGTKLNQHQYNALVSFAYNVGTDALRKSTLLQRVHDNPSNPTIRDAFMMWDKVHHNGQLVVVPGLAQRRKEEADLYFGLS